MGGSLDRLKGKVILEAGCGAGRFTEVLLNAGANVFAVDLSSAVEANGENCGEHKECFLCQADIVNLPVAPEQFDVVVAIGMIQHTRCPEETIGALCSHLKPGGLLALDHYTYGYEVTRTRRLLRSFLLRNGARYNLRFCKRLVSLLWPIHRLFWKYRATRRVPRLRNLFLDLSPVVDYHEAYPQLSPDLLRTWAILDTHDTLTDVYKHFRSMEEIRQCLERNYMTEIETVCPGNGVVEARAEKPVR
jgi:SAM-dependent methyltransferase